MSRTVVMIGLFVPSTAVLVGLGGLVGLGKLDFWPIVFAITRGAILGDAISRLVLRVWRHRVVAAFDGGAGRGEPVDYWDGALYGERIAHPFRPTSLALAVTLPRS